MLFAMRISLPDEPGTLGSVAAAVSHEGADIVHLEVVDHQDGFAVDELYLDTSDRCSAWTLRRLAEAVPGVVVESIRAADRAPDRLAALELAETLAQPGPGALAELVDGLPAALACAWAMALDATGSGLVVVHATPSALPPGVMETPWLPLTHARRLGAADWMPPRWKAARFELAAAPVDGPLRCVLVARWAGMRFRPSELRALRLLAGIAARSLGGGAAAMAS